MGTYNFKSNSVYAIKHLQYGYMKTHTSNGPVLFDPHLSPRDSLFAIGLTRPSFLQISSPLHRSKLILDDYEFRSKIDNKSARFIDLEVPAEIHGGTRLMTILCQPITSNTSCSITAGWHSLTGSPGVGNEIVGIFKSYIVDNEFRYIRPFEIYEAIGCNDSHCQSLNIIQPYTPDPESSPSYVTDITIPLVGCILLFIGT